MKTILLIEDNRDMRENTAEILELSNYKVITAENGKIGVEMAKKHKPDLIICDVMMPELDGFGVLHILSKDAATASIPFIFLTAKTEKDDFRKGMNLGADDYLTKPFDDVELLDAVAGRIKKNDLLKQEYGRTKEGLDEFLTHAGGLMELDKLIGNRKHRLFKKKETLFHEGDFPNALFFIYSGKVKTFKTNEDGKEYITGLHKEGDFLGYLALLEESDYTETAMAFEDCEVGIIPKQDFFDLLGRNRDVAAKFIKMLSNNLNETEDRLIKMAYNSVRKRVAEALLFLYNKYSAEGSNSFSMAITRDDLAKIVGTAKETVIRTLSDFKDEKLIDIKGKDIVIVNKAKLERMKN